MTSDFTVTTYLINHSAGFRRLDPTDHSPLDLAAHHAKDTKVLELLLTKVEIDQNDSNGITALYIAPQSSLTPYPLATC
jgi:hypothetical protein